jgi:hypothetical protein
MDTAEDSDVIVRFVRLGHEMHYPLPVASSSSERLRLLPRNEWRFEAASEFSDGSKQWMLWAASEANLKQMAALARDTHWHAAEHKLKLPQAATVTWQV